MVLDPQRAAILFSSSQAPSRKPPSLNEVNEIISIIEVQNSQTNKTNEVGSLANKLPRKDFDFNEQAPSSGSRSFRDPNFFNL